MIMVKFTTSYEKQRELGLIIFNFCDGNSMVKQLATQELIMGFGSWTIPQMC